MNERTYLISGEELAALEEKSVSTIRRAFEANPDQVARLTKAEAREKGLSWGKTGGGKRDTVLLLRYTAASYRMRPAKNISLGSRRRTSAGRRAAPRRFPVPPLKAGTVKPPSPLLYHQDRPRYPRRPRKKPGQRLISLPRGGGTGRRTERGVS